LEDDRSLGVLPSGQTNGTTLNVMAPPRSGAAEIEFVDTTDIFTFGWTGHCERLVLRPPMVPPPQLPAWSNISLPDIIVQEHEGYLALPPTIAAYAITDALLIDSGFVYCDNRLVYLRDCFPDYWGIPLESGELVSSIGILKPDAWMKRREIRVDMPVSCPIHQNMIYGHFLLEMLPRAAGLASLRRQGARFAVALPSTLSDWAKTILGIYFDPLEIIWFNPNTDVVVAPSIILTSMMHCSYNFHPELGEVVHELLGRLGAPTTMKSDGSGCASDRRIFISRSRVWHDVRLINAEKIEATAQDLGFEIVHPQEMSFAEQVRLFHEARVVMGEAGSALHNVLFSQPGTRVISLNMFSWYQSAIGRLRQLPHAFIAPEDGHFRHWRMLEGRYRIYAINPSDVRLAFQAMCGDL
jgi:hypothetical protein